MILFGSELIKVGTEYTALVSAANEPRYCYTLSIALSFIHTGLEPGDSGARRSGNRFNGFHVGAVT